MEIGHEHTQRQYKTQELPEGGSFFDGEKSDTYVEGEEVKR